MADQEGKTTGRTSAPVCLVEGHPGASLAGYQQTSALYCLRLLILKLHDIWDWRKDMFVIGDVKMPAELRKLKISLNATESLQRRAVSCFGTITQFCRRWLWLHKPHGMEQDKLASLAEAAPCAQILCKGKKISLNYHLQRMAFHAAAEPERLAIN